MGRRSALSTRLGGAVVALLLLAGSAPAQDLSRAGPALRFILTHRPEPAPAALRLAPGQPSTMPGLPGTALERDAGRLWVRTLVRVGPGGEAALRDARAEVRTRAGDIVTARVPLDAVTGLLSADGVVIMEAAAALAPLGLPTALSPAIGAPSAAPLPLPNDSANAVSGFDELRRRVG